MKKLDLASLIGRRRSARRPHQGQLNLTSVSGQPRRARRRQPKRKSNLAFLSGLLRPIRSRRRTRTLNFRFLGVLLAVVAVLGASIHFVHAYQLRRNASTLLDRAHRAEADQDLKKATQALQRYLDIDREDGPTWAWYARLVDRRTPEGPDREEVYLVHEEALRHHPEDRELERRCAELALELKRYSDARRHFLLLHQRAPKDPRGEPVDAELEDLLGQCDQGETRYADAERWFRQAIKHDPGHITSYDRLARMLRKELQQPEVADWLIETMVEANPRSARAYLTRWQYQRESRQDVDARDLQQALQLGPEDPQVLVAAAGASEQEGDTAAAREYLQKGVEVAPRDTAFALRLAQLEVRDGHPDRAETVLRQAVQANPQTELWYLLADTLIGQGKIEGKDQAEAIIARLRERGLREGYLQQLEAGILIQRHRWSEAIAKIQTARSLLVADPPVMSRLDLMLATCYGHLGLEDRRLAALEQAGGTEATGAGIAVELAEELARSGRLDEAMAIHRRLAARRPESRLDLVRLEIQKALRQPDGRRDWREAERRLREAEDGLPQQAPELTLLRADLLAARGRPDEARTEVEAARARSPRDARYRIALANLARSRGDAAGAVQVLEQAERDLGPSLALRLARLESWVGRGGPEAQAALAELARTRSQLPPADQPAFLAALAQAADRLGEVPLARQSWSALLALQPDNLGVMMGLFDLALEAGDSAAAAELVGKLRQVEGEEGTLWRFGQVLSLIDQARRGGTQGLGHAQELVSEILARRGDWWGGPYLKAELAELDGDLGTAIPLYLRAIELGNARPALARRLVGLLFQRQEFDQIDRVVQLLRDRGLADHDLTSATALGALRRRDFERGIALARQAFPASSTRATDHLSLGRLLLAAGRGEEGGKELQRAVELDPGLPDAWLAYVEYLVQGRQLDQAKAAVDAARKALPAERSAGTLGRCLALIGEIQQAEALFRAAVISRPNDPATLRSAAGFYVERRRYEQAQPLLTKLADPKTGASPADLAWANRTRGLMGLAAGRPAGVDQALGLLEQNLKANPYDVGDRRLRAILLAVRTSRRPEALHQLEAFQIANRLSPEEQFLLAIIYKAEGQPERYRAEMLELLAGSEKDSRHLAHFIAFLIGRHELDQAERWLAELRRQQPESLTTLALEAQALKAAKRDQDLLALLQARTRQHPDQLGAVARVLNELGFAREAEATYKADIARAPQQAEPALALAHFLARRNRPGEALEVLKGAWTNGRPEQVAVTALAAYDAPLADEAQKGQIEAWVVEAIRQRPQATDLVPKLAAIRLRQGRYDEAQSLYRRALAGGSEDPQALNDLAWVLSQRDPSPSKLREALALINRAIDVAGEDPDRLDTRAVILLQLGQARPALLDLGRALKLRPSAGGIHLHLARAHWMTKNEPEARKALRRAVELGLNLETVDPLERAGYLQLRQELDFR
jgi:tetratricopeptide (TPR) repeat protein